MLSLYVSFCVWWYTIKYVSLVRLAHTMKSSWLNPFIQKELIRGAVWGEMPHGAICTLCICVSVGVCSKFFIR